ncbi:MAG: hypothetical protein AB1483_11580 [Candidatus Zixiibacteriota bacterium]
MFRKIIFFAVITAALFSTDVTAQSEYLRDGEHGIGLAGSLMFGRDVGGGGGTIGYRIAGNLDFSASIAHNTDANTKSYSTAFTYHIKQGNKRNVFGVAVLAGFTAAEHTVHYGRQNFFLVGLAVYDNLYVSSQFVVQPYLSHTFGVLTGHAWERTQASMDLGLTFGFAQREEIRPFLGVAGVIPDNGTNVFVTAGGGLVLVW